MKTLITLLWLLDPKAVQHAKDIDFYAKKYRFDPLLVAAIIEKESDFRSNRCYLGAYGLMQIQLSPRSCKKTIDRAKKLSLLNSAVNIHEGVKLMHLWRHWTYRNDCKHHWLLNYNQGYGSCTGSKRSCRLEKRVPARNGYAKRVLQIYYFLKRKQNQMHFEENFTIVKDLKIFVTQSSVLNSPFN